MNISSVLFEIFGSRGIYKDGWFACTFGPRNPWNPYASTVKGWNPYNDVWELYNLENDPHELSNIAYDPKNVLIISEMRELLLDWMSETEDPNPITLPNRLSRDINFI